MTMRLRQIALAARDLDPTLDTLCDVLGIEVAFNDPGVGVFGLVNGVMPIGETFLEVVSPIRSNATAARWIERRGGDSGYMVIFQVDDFAPHRERLAQLGVRIVWEGKQHGAATLHLHPRDVGGAIVSFDTMDTPGAWKWAGPKWREHVRTEVTRAIVGAEIEGPAPERLAARWSEVLGIAAKPDAQGRPAIAVRGGELRFVRGASDGVFGVLIDVADRARFRAA
ncbi:MAG TPA: VOC family protein, partial [Myxococcota bacterium]|nr:VOC family protein [Myxococcota bacterium]